MTRSVSLVRGRLASVAALEFSVPSAAFAVLARERLHSSRFLRSRGFTSALRGAMRALLVGRCIQKSPKGVVISEFMAIGISDEPIILT